MRKKWNRMLAVTLSVAVSLPTTPIYAGQSEDATEQVAESVSESSAQEEEKAEVSDDNVDDEVSPDKETNTEEKQEEQEKTDSSDKKEDLDVDDKKESDNIGDEKQEEGKDSDASDEDEIEDSELAKDEDTDNLDKIDSDESKERNQPEESKENADSDQDKTEADDEEVTEEKKESANEEANAANPTVSELANPSVEEAQIVAEEEDTVDIPVAILYLDENEENGYRVGEEDQLTFDCIRNKPEGHEGFKHQVLGRKLYAGITEKYKDSIDTSKYEILGVTSYAASANPTYNVKEDGGTAFSYSDGTTATLYLVVKEKVKEQPTIFKYTVGFYAGDDVTGLPEDLAVERAENEVTLTLPSEIPSRNGYTFIGWATEENGTVVYRAGQEVILNTSVQNLNLYAVWQENEDPSQPDTPDVPSDPSQPDTPDVPSEPSAPDNGNNSNNSGNHSGGGSSSSSSSDSSHDSSSSTSASGTWKQNENGTWSYLLSNNSSASGWKSISGTNGFSWYHFASDGIMDTGWYKESDTTWYYLEVSGANEGQAVGGFLTNQPDGNTYYLDPTSKAMAVGWKQIDGAWYFFNNVYGNGWSYDEETNKWMFKDGNSLPLGAMLKNTTTPDGYHVGEDGKRIEQ